MTTAVLKQALDALEAQNNLISCLVAALPGQSLTLTGRDYPVDIPERITALRQAISQPEMWTDCEFRGDPPEGYKDWLDFADAKVKRGVVVTSITSVSQPDCRGCEHSDYFDSSYCETATCVGCTDGDKFRTVVPIQFYKRRPNENAQTS